jgi:formylmethanofuran dehydrogenase subunit B
VGLGDRLGGLVDSVTSATVSRAVLAAQERGRAGATLGEVRHRADVLVYWGVDPSLRYPRYQSRYTPAVVDPVTCRVVAVDVGSSRGPGEAHLRVAVAPRDEVAVLTALQGAIGRQPAEFRGEGAEAGEEVWRLASALSGARYAVIVADGEPDPVTADRDPYRADALLALAQALNGPSRGALSLLRAGGNRSGADAVMTWQTGYPMAVDFARGYPRYTPHEGTASRRLSRGEADAVLVIGSAALLPEHAASIGPRGAVIGPRASASVYASRAAVIDTGVAGIHDAGTALRMDDVPLPLRASMRGPADTAAIVRALSERIVARRRDAIRGR